MTIANLQQQRERIPLTREQVAQTLGIPEQLLSSWERGRRNPGLYQLEQLARLYRVNTGYLLGKEDLQERPAADSAKVRARSLVGFFRQLGRVFRRFGQDTRIASAAPRRR